MTLPLAKLDLLLGYGLAFGILAAVQAVVVCGIGFLALGLDAPHGAWLVGLLAIGNALLGMALGLLLSAFARTEFQAVQFMPAFVFPQLLLCGLFVARDQMAPALETASWALPFTYAYDALDRVTHAGALGGGLVRDVVVVALVTAEAGPRRAHAAPPHAVGVAPRSPCVRSPASPAGGLGWARGAVNDPLIGLVCAIRPQVRSRTTGRAPSVQVDDAGGDQQHQRDDRGDEQRRQAADAVGEEEEHRRGLPGGLSRTRSYIR